jgi:hypothetical protein
VRREAVERGPQRNLKSIKTLDLRRAMLHRSHCFKTETTLHGCSNPVLISLSFCDGIFQRGSSKEREFSLKEGVLQ